MASIGLKDMSKSRKAKLGTFIVEFATPGIGHIAHNAGCDFVLLDMEHSAFSHETVKSAIRYFEAAGVRVIVRSPSRDYTMIARACDAGAEGVMVPMVSTAEEARMMLDHMKYFPHGKRGVALSIAHDNYSNSTASVADRMQAANDRLTFFCQIETAEGAENVDAIAAVEGVDCLWVGHFDLSTSLGIPGQFEHPKYIAAMDRIIAAAKKHNKALGRLVPSTDLGIALFKDGFDFCCYSGDVWLLQQALSEGISRLKAGCV